MLARAGSCIACRLLRRYDAPDHLLVDCRYSPNPHSARYKQHYTEWCHRLKFPLGTCYRCGCPQHVSQLYYSIGLKLNGL